MNLYSPIYRFIPFDRLIFLFHRVAVFQLGTQGKFNVHYTLNSTKLQFGTPKKYDDQPRHFYITLRAVPQGTLLPGHFIWHPPPPQQRAFQILEIFIHETQLARMAATTAKRWPLVRAPQNYTGHLRSTWRNSQLSNPASFYPDTWGLGRHLSRRLYIRFHLHRFWRRSDQLWSFLWRSSFLLCTCRHRVYSPVLSYCWRSLPRMRE